MAINGKCNKCANTYGYEVFKGSEDLEFGLVYVETNFYYSIRLETDGCDSKEMLGFIWRVKNLYKYDI